MPEKEIKVFYSYSHKDSKLRERLERHLSLLKREGVIAQWHDRQIGVGTEWNRQIHDALNSADVILLLVSADFLASDYCYDIEMKRALELHEAGTARVIPIILRPCEWQRALFAKLQALPLGGRAVVHWRDQDSAFTDVARGIREAVNAIKMRTLELELNRWKTVVVADDEKAIADTLVLIFNQYGFEAHAARSGEEAVKLAKELRPLFVLTDVIMRDMNGVDAGIQIRKEVPGCTVILFSGQAATEMLLARAHEQGYDFEFYSKPVDPNIFISRLRQDKPESLDPSK
jgi:CheY-like chemotaxis protein